MEFKLPSDWYRQSFEDILRAMIREEIEKSQEITVTIRESHPVHAWIGNKPRSSR